MCFATPGKIISVDEKTTLAEINGRTKEVKAELFDVSPGDYVLCFGSYVIEKITEEQAKEFIQCR
jgi:hydrogenase assembly chaperone HypC/HupF